MLLIWRDRYKAEFCPMGRDDLFSNVSRTKAPTTIGPHADTASNTKD